MSLILYFYIFRNLEMNEPNAYNEMKFIYLYHHHHHHHRRRRRHIYKFVILYN
jgi:hypothetical protein